MQIVHKLIIKKISEPSIEKVILSTEDKVKLIKELFRENKEIYLRAKAAGKASFDDKNRYLEIRRQLIELRAI